MKNIEEIVKRSAEKFNAVVVELSIENGKIEAVLYRKGKGLTVLDLEELTYLIKHDLKVIGEDENFDINLSTPGLDRVLKDRKEIDIFEGCEVRFYYTEENKKLMKEGILRGSNGDLVLFEVDGETISLPISKIIKIELFERMFEKRRGGKK
ncbi:MAG: hypothetical protein K6343_00770 [Caldisericaceae bacterium]